MSTKQEFMGHWIRSLLKNLDEGLGKEETIRLLKMFAAVTGETVQVELEKSTTRGDPNCEFLITLPAAPLP